MTLKDLMQLCYRAGFDDVDGFEAWWASEGEDRQDEFLTEGDAQRDIDGKAGDED